MVGDSDFTKELSAALPALQKHARKRVRQVTIAEDLVQDTLVEALKKAEDFQPGTDIDAWLAVIFRRVASNYWRREATRREYAKTERPGEAMRPVQVERSELRDAAAIMESLPPDQNEAMFLIVLEERSYEEAAQILGCSPGTVKSRVSRARKAINSAMVAGMRPDNAPHEGSAAV